MCTVSFLPTESGYVVSMNRDDLLVRARTSAPSISQVGCRTAIYPTEPGGGTWIGTNDAGLTFCLLNWNWPAGPKLRSRGEVIPKLLASDSLCEAGSLLSPELLRGRLPFRLVGISLNDQVILEWRWDGLATVAPIPFTWQLNHWFSSGLSDEEARRQRIPVCRDALSQADARTTDWLRRLHRSHAPEQGAFSICAHRPEAGTLSYTEIAVSNGLTQVSYTDASPCMEHAFSSVCFCNPPALPSCGL